MQTPAEYVKPLPQLPGWGGMYCAATGNGSVATSRQATALYRVMGLLVVIVPLLIAFSGCHESNSQSIASSPSGVAAACVVRSKHDQFSCVTP